MEILKACSTCDVPKDYDKDFSWMSKEHKKKFRQCKECRNKYRKSWRERNPDKPPIDTLRVSMKRLGLDEDFEKFYVEHSGRCDICGLKQSERGKDKRLAIDHDHVTGKIRGLLCSKCNVSLGLMEDNPDWLRSAAEYLEKNV